MWVKKKKSWSTFKDYLQFTCSMVSLHVVRKSSHLGPKSPRPFNKNDIFSNVTVGGTIAWLKWNHFLQSTQVCRGFKVICWHSHLTSTMDLGKSSALKSCSMESMMFFHPSRKMSPWRWARLNMVLAATWAFLLLPNTVGRFSTD